MLAGLRRRMPGDVRTKAAAFEELEAGERFDLFCAAAALHWTKPDGRWERVAALLEPDVVMHLARRKAGVPAPTRTPAHP
jgi:hypothetical protein